MGKKPKWHVFIVIAVLSITLSCSCASSSDSREADTGKLRELGDVMVDDLKREVLPNRKDTRKLAEIGYVVEKDGKTDGIDALVMFYNSHESGNDGQITIVFDRESFVVSRIAFVDGDGYYLRYEYDKSNPDVISVSGKLVDAVDLKYKEDPPKWEMILNYGKKQIALFTLKNPA